MGPELVHDLNYLDEVTGARGFLDVGIRPEHVRLVHVLLVFGGAEHDRWNHFALGMGLQPLQHVKSAESGHLDIEQHHVRKPIFFAISEFAFALQIVDGLLSIFHTLEVIPHPALLERPLHEEEIFLGIIGHQHFEAGFCPLRHAPFRSPMLPKRESGVLPGQMQKTPNSKFQHPEKFQTADVEETRKTELGRNTKHQAPEKLQDSNSKQPLATRHVILYGIGLPAIENVRSSPSGDDGLLEFGY